MSKSSEPVHPFIVSDPRILDGEVVIAGTRVPLRSITYLVAEHYPTAADTVTAALQAPDQLSQAESTAAQSEPVESLEDILNEADIDYDYLIESGAGRDKPTTAFRDLRLETIAKLEAYVEREKQKTRIEELEGIKALSPDNAVDNFVLGQIDRRIMELEEGNNKDC